METVDVLRERREDFLRLYEWLEDYRSRQSLYGRRGDDPDGDRRAVAGQSLITVSSCLRYRMVIVEIGVSDTGVAESLKIL